MYPSFLQIKGSSDSCSMSQAAEENVASAQVPAVSELEALGTLRNKNNMFEFLCEKYYLNMSNTICFLSQTSCCFLWEEISEHHLEMHLPLCPAFMVPLCCEAQAEMQTEAVKVEVLQSGEAPYTAGGTYMYLHLPSKNRVSIRFQATGWSVRNVHMLEISFWYWIAIPFGLWLVSPLALFTIKRNFPLPTMEDAKTIVDSYWHQYCQMKDWIGQAWFCATLQLSDFSFFGCHIFLLLRSEDAEVAKNSICEDMRFFRSSIDWWWENERWLVAGNYTVKQNLLHLYIVRCCNSLLIVFHGGCEDDCRFLLASILPDEGLDWTSMILCNSATLWFFIFWMPHFPLAALGGCGSRKKFDLRGHEFYFLIFSVIYRLVVREWEVVGSGKLYSQTESSSSIYCSLLQFRADCFPWRMRRRLSIPTGINIARWRTGLDKHDSVQLCNSLIFRFLDATFSSCCARRMRKSQKIRSARTWVLFSNFFGHLSIGGERMRGGW